MSSEQQSEYQAARKKAWRIYAAIIFCLILVLVFVVARDNEERFFYSLMTLGASYAFRPNDEQLNALIKRFLGVEAPASAVEAERVAQDNSDDKADS